MDKRLKKLRVGRCIFCHEDDYAVLDVHRILEGCNGGEYINGNVIVVCANCHRRLHRGGGIEVDRWYESTGGRLLRCIINGNEHYFSE